MTTSLLYHAYGIMGVKQTATKYENGQVVIAAEMTHNSIHCPNCKNYQGFFRGKRIRRFCLPPFGNKRCFLDLTLHRVECHNCHHLYWPLLSFMPGTKRMTRSFIRYVLGLLKFGTIKDVANHAGLGWTTVKELHAEVLEKRYNDIPLTDVEYVTVDEFSIRRGHKYMTVFSDLKTGRIIHAVEGRKQEDIEPFLQRLKKNPLNCEQFVWT